MKDQITDASIAAAASKSTYTGSGLMITGWLLSSQMAVLVGMIVGILGLVVNVYFKVKQDRRDQALHDEKIKQLKK